MNCPYCGMELPEGTHFCSECGKDLHMSNTAAAEVDVPSSENDVLAENAPETVTVPAVEVESAEEATEAASSATEETVTEEPVVQPAAPMMESAASPQTKVYHGVLDKKPEKHSRWATIGTWGWFGILLLLSIPVVNIICLLVWSFGGARKQVKQSFARATLIMMLLSLILSVACMIVVHQFGPAIVEQLAAWFAF